ncbi:MAG: flagellar hook-associated protein FlgL [Sulfurospirillaceae bacterium]|nr:flagellar hook-associated protein FlgL [Sulfurospirillaceae bacterium]
MRITNSLFYLNTLTNYQSNMKSLYDANSQISSGTKIQNSYQDSGVYSETMRLNSELTTLKQVQDNSSAAQTFANNTDSAMNQMNDMLTQFKTKLIQAANGSNSTTSLTAIANDLQSLRDSFASVANTSINGQFIFSGSAVSVKPINNDGTYNGNDNSLTSVIGSNVKLPYNIDGQSLFLGKDSDYSKSVSTNVVMYNQTTLANNGGKVNLKSSDTIQDMVGGNATTNGKPVFYLSGRKPNGDTFNTKISISTTSKVSDLLDSIGAAYGNTATNQVVNVSLNSYGQIEVKGVAKGNSLLQMNIFGAIDRTAAGTVGTADQTDINNLSAQPNVDIIGFLKSNFINSSTTLSDASNYSVRGFAKDGNVLSSNVSQFVKSTSDYATPATKLSEVAGSSTLDGKQFNLTGKDTNGNTFNAKLNLSNSASGSTFTVGGNTYTIFDASGNPTKADNVTYQQLNDVVSMITSGTMPTTNTVTDYNSALTSAQQNVSVSLDNQGKMQIKDNNKTSSSIEFTMYDSNNSTFNGTSAAPALTFMANDAITTDGPNLDIFKQLDNMIQAVKDGNFNMDSTSSDPRNIGIQNSLLQIQHISDHVNKMHTKIGSYSNALQRANDRASFLSLNVTKVKSKVADVDIAQAYLNFSQLSNSYQAMLSTIAKINSMSLLKYM